MAGYILEVQEETSQIVIHHYCEGHPLALTSTTFKSRFELQERWGRRESNDFLLMHVDRNLLINFLQSRVPIRGVSDLEKNIHISELLGIVWNIFDKIAISSRMEYNCNTSKKIKNAEFHFDLNSVQEKINSNAGPRQLIVIYKLLIEGNLSSFDRSEIEDLLEKNKELLNTKQPPYRIFSYYLKNMREHKCLLD
jgi:hypothetical protein